MRIGDEERFLIEVKAIGISLKDRHVKQAMEYGAHKGIEWVVLTNGAVWRVYKVHFKQPIDQTLVFEIDLTQPSVKIAQLVECFSILSREVFSQVAMTMFYQQKQVTSKYTIAALLQSQAMIGAVRKELKKLDSKVRFDDEDIKSLLISDIIKRELIDSEEGKEAAEFLKKIEKAAARAKAKKVSN